VVVDVTGLLPKIEDDEAPAPNGDPCGVVDVPSAGFPKIEGPPNAEGFAAKGLGPVGVPAGVVDALLALFPPNAKLKAGAGAGAAPDEGALVLLVAGVPNAGVALGASSAGFAPNPPNALFAPPNADDVLLLEPAPKAEGAAVPPPAPLKANPNAFFFCSPSAPAGVGVGVGVPNADPDAGVKLNAGGVAVVDCFSAALGAANENALPPAGCDSAGAGCFSAGFAAANENALPPAGLGSDDPSAPVKDEDDAAADEAGAAGLAANAKLNFGAGGVAAPAGACV
jgi:hypothetical protein